MSIVKFWFGAIPTEGQSRTHIAAPGTNTSRLTEGLAEKIWILERKEHL